MAKEAKEIEGNFMKRKVESWVFTHKGKKYRAYTDGFRTFTVMLPIVKKKSFAKLCTFDSANNAS